MQIERLILCPYGDWCRVQNCPNLHSKDKNFEMKVIEEKAKYQIKCQKGSNCQNQHYCLDIHPGEIIPILCNKKLCDRNDCIFFHEDDNLWNHQYQKEQQLQQQNLNQLQKANQYKDKGNQLFNEQKYEEAILMFSKAIEIEPNISIFYSNRALSNKKLEKWEEVHTDSKIAISFDQQNLRGQYLLIISEIELLKFNKNCNMLYLLNDYLNQLCEIEIIAKQKNNKSLMDLSVEKQKITQIQEIFQQYKPLLDLISIIERYNNININKTIIPLLWQKIEQYFGIQQQHLPDFLICPITLLPYQQPMLISSGHTYEEQAIKEHFKKNGYFDPITRQQVISNLPAIQNVNLIQAINNYENNYQGQTFTSFSFS